MTVAVGLDLGTSGLKGVVLDDMGRVVATAQRGYPTRRPVDGAAEQDPADWWKAATAVLADLAAAVDPASWAGIGLSAMIPTLVVLDTAGEPIGSAITWQDARAEPQAARLAAAVGADHLYALTGQRVDGRYLLPMAHRLLSSGLLISGRPAAGRTVAVAGAKDLLFLRFTGELATDPSTAAGFGCFDLATGEWSAEVLAAWNALLEDDDPVRGDFGAPAVPPVRPSHHSRQLLPAVADLLGVPRCLTVTLGGADSVLGLLGLGLGRDSGPGPGERPGGGPGGRDGTVAYIAGTSSVIIGTAPAGTPPDPLQRCLLTPLAGLDGIGIEMDLLTTGDALRWLATVTGDGTLRALLAESVTVPPEETPVFLPYVGPGEQGALWDPTLTGTLLGLTVRHERRHLVRALQVGIVLESRRCLQVLHELAGVAGEVRLAGGGASAEFARDLADATGRRVVRVGTGAERDDASAVGGALLVGTSPGGPSRALAAEGAEVTEPDESRAPVWAALAARHDAALDAARAFSRTVAG